MEEYLTTQELSARIKYSKQTIYNKIYKKEFVEEKHFIKPSRKKILFKWSEIQVWLEGISTSENLPANESDQEDDTPQDSQIQDTPQSLINI